MATAPRSISLEEYMNTSYSPDCEYIDGVVVERNVGQGKHAYTQTEISALLRALAKKTSLIALVEHRVRVSPGRVRVPDVCVVTELEEVISQPPLLCVEIFSPDDRWRRVNQSVGDYQGMGVPYVWVIHPYERRAWIFSQDQPPAEVQDDALKAEALGIGISLTEILPPG